MAGVDGPLVGGPSPLHVALLDEQPPQVTIAIGTKVRVAGVDGPLVCGASPVRVSFFTQERAHAEGSYGRYLGVPRLGSPPPHCCALTKPTRFAGGQTDRQSVPGCGCPLLGCLPDGIGYGGRTSLTAVVDDVVGSAHRCIAGGFQQLHDLEDARSAPLQRRLRIEARGMPAALVKVHARDLGRAACSQCLRAPRGASRRPPSPWCPVPTSPRWAPPSSRL